MKLTLPLKPLSINEAWRGRHYATPKYKQWTEDGLWLLKGHTSHLKGILRVEMDWYSKNIATADIDNPVKPCLDLLKKAKIIEDDRFIVELLVRKHQDNNERYEIELEEIKTGV